MKLWDLSTKIIKRGRSDQRACFVHEHKLAFYDGHQLSLGLGR